MTVVCFGMPGPVVSDEDGEAAVTLHDGAGLVIGRVSLTTRALLSVRWDGDRRRLVFRYANDIVMFRPHRRGEEDDVELACCYPDSGSNEGFEAA